MSSTTYSLRPCKLCGSYPRYGYRTAGTHRGPIIEIKCNCHGVHADSEAVASTTWNAMNLPDEKPRE
jgi:hypothetical protein